MEKRSRKSVDHVVGLDLGDRFSYFVKIDQGRGEVVDRGRVRTTIKALAYRFAAAPRMRIAIEVGSQSPWVSRRLESWGHEVVIANPRKVQLISGNRSKSDRVDAEVLARLARVDRKLLAPMRHRSARTQADLAVLRSRDALVRTRTLLINHVRGSSKSVGVALPKCSAKGFANKVEAVLPEELSEALQPIVGQIRSLTERIVQFDKQIEKMADEVYPQSKLLRQIQGVGVLTSMSYLLVLEDPARFRTSRAVGPYIGLVPRRKGSGESSPQLRITKEGDPFLRRHLVSAAHYILGAFGEDSDLRRHGLRIAQRGGKNAKKRAVVAVARKLAVLMHRLWRDGEVYDPLHNARTGDEKKLQAAS